MVLYTRIDPIEGIFSDNDNTKKMSFDIMIFIPEAAPKDRDGFMSWFYTQMKQKESKYGDPEIASSPLKNYFFEAIKTFPPINGPHSSEDFDNKNLTEYLITKNSIYMEFRWSVAEEAYEFSKKLAIKYRVGFFDVSTNKGSILIPDSNGDYRSIENKIHHSLKDEISDYDKNIRSEDVFSNRFKSTEKDVSDNTPNQSILFKGNVTGDAGKTLINANIKFYKDGSQVYSKITNSSGKYPDFETKLGHIYVFEVSKKGYVTKNVQINTKSDYYEDIPLKMQIALDISIFKASSGVNYSLISNKPVAKLYIDSTTGSFSSDIQYYESRNNEIEAFLRKIVKNKNELTKFSCKKNWWNWFGRKRL